MVVVKDGRLVTERNGQRSHATTPLTGCSATKSVGSAIVGRLVDEGDATCAESNLAARS